MIKIILAIVVIVLLAYIGYGIERYYKTRLKILVDFKNFISFCKREIEFYKSSIDTLINKYDYQTESLKKLLDCYVNNKEMESIYLNKDIISRFKTFIYELSSADFYFKDSVIKSAEEVIASLLNQAEKDKKQKGELGRKLIVLLGIALIVLII